MYRMKRTYMYTLITMLGFVASVACSNPSENRIIAEKSESSQSVTESEKAISTPIFKIYGELSPVNYLNGGEDSLTLAHGFLVERVSGCEVTAELVQSVKENNRLANEQMIASFGKTWIADFKKKTGMNLTFPQF